MKCPKCGFVSFNYLDTCKRCGMNLSAHKQKLGITIDPAFVTNPPKPISAPEARGENRTRTLPTHPARTPRPATPTASSTQARADVADLERERARLSEEVERLRREAAEGGRQEAERAAREQADVFRRQAEEEARARALELRRIAEQEALEKAEEIRRRIEKEALERAEELRRQVEREAHAEAGRIRVQKEAEAREEAELFRRQKEKEALAEAALLRQRMEQEVREEADRFRRKAEKEANEEAERIRRRTERQSLEEAEKIRKLTKRQAREEADRFMRQAEQKAQEEAERIRGITEQEVARESEKIRNQKEKEALELGDRIRALTEKEIREEAVRIRARKEREAVEETQKLRMMTVEEVRQEAEKIRTVKEREAIEEAMKVRLLIEQAAREESDVIRRQKELEAEEWAQALRRRSEVEAREQIDSIRRRAVEEADALRQQAQEEVEDVKRRAEAIARETIQSAFDAAGVNPEREFPSGLSESPIPPEVSPTIIEIESFATNQQVIEAKEVSETSGEVPYRSKAMPEKKIAAEPKKMKNIPTAGDYLDLLAKKATAKEMPPAGNTRSEDFPARESAAGAFSTDHSASDGHATRPREMRDEELDEVIEIEEEPHEAMAEAERILGPGGLFLRMLGGFLDVSILVAVIALFLVIGKAAFSIAGQSPGWSYFLHLSGPIYALFFLITTGYYTIFIGSTGQTLAMMVLGLKVVSKDGGSLGYNMAFFRHSASLVFLLLLGTGFWAMLFDPNRQGWHDKLARSLVVRV